MTVGVLGPPPALGGHDLQYYPVSTYAGTTITTDAIVTQAAGSSLVVCLSRASSLSSAPTDNKGNTLTQLGSKDPYNGWPAWGTSLWADAVIAGGSGHTVSADMVSNDEITVFAVEIMNGGTISDYDHTQVDTESPLVGGSVTTTGPAVLISFWWGNGGVESHTATPNNGFTVIESLLLSGSVIQGAVAVRVVSRSGTYGVSWTSNDPGGQTWLVAVE